MIPINTREKKCKKEDFRKFEKLLNKTPLNSKNILYIHLFLFYNSSTA